MGEKQSQPSQLSSGGSLKVDIQGAHVTPDESHHRPPLMGRNLHRTRRKVCSTRRETRSSCSAQMSATSGFESKSSRILSSDRFTSTLK